MFSISLLFLISCATSAVAGVLGLGGGMLLIALLPFLLPAAAIIPLHATAQIASNGSRAIFAIRSVQWQLFPWFLFGSIVGVIAFAWLIRQLNIDNIPIFIALYILLSQWSLLFNRLIKQWETFFLAGFFQTGLGLLVGATGPLTMTLLKKCCADKEQIVATSALMMLVSHLCKVIVFASIGLHLIALWPEATALVLGAITGSWLGTQYRQTISTHKFQLILKWLLTFLACLMLFRAFIT